MDSLKKLGAVLVAGMILAQAAQASTAPERLETQMINLPNIGKVPYARLFEETSKPGESLDQFMQRIGVRMRDFSDRTGYEACAAVASDGERFGVVVGTNTSHIACAVLGKVVPDGMTALYKTIHTHGNAKEQKLNVADMRFRGIPENARSRSMHGTVFGQDVRMFSPEDLKGAPGYLATPEGGLIHHDGKGDITVVSP